MFRSASYPILRTFTSLAIGLTLVCTSAVSHAEDALEVANAQFEDAKGTKLFMTDFRGRPVVINLWATWCGPCVSEMSSLVELQRAYMDKDLVVLSLSEDDLPTSATDFFKNKSITAFPPYFDRDHRTWLAMHGRGIPTSVLVNRQGYIVKRLEGAINWQTPDMQKQIDDLTAKPKS